MEKTEKVEAYYETEHRFKEEIIALRALALQTSCEEDYKWNFPVYTVNGKMYSVFVDSKITLGFGSLMDPF
ncbi:hypothetical protein [Flagellimonas onchidii]|uniref:hypothetical protein n=1 Tax=Flagellimonas onchidii TaxID=2562684 RepID=UPI0028BF1D59|nr:hypothetical protein [Allomuricauda onchidii]